MIPEANRSTILIIDNLLSDDNSIFTLFENYNYHVVTAKNGEQGLQDAQRLMPDLILLDVILPDLDGFEVCRRLKENDTLRDTPVIFMTLAKSIGYMTKSLKAGGVDCMVKPLQSDELMVRVTTQIKLRRLEQQNAQLEQRLARCVEQNKQLLVSEHLYHSLLENHPDGIIRFDPQGRHLYISQLALDLTGTKLSTLSLLGKTVCELPIPGNPELMQPLLNAVLKIAATAITDTIEFIWCNGNVSEIRLIPELNEQGEVFSVLAIARDITELKQAEFLHKAKERELFTLVENSPDIIVRYDRDCRLTFFNQAYLRQTGTPVEYAINSIDTVGVWRPTMPAAEYHERLQQIMSTGVSDKILLEWKDNDGLHVSYEMYVAAEYDADGMVIGVLAVGRDLSEHKRMEEEITYRENKFRTLAENSPNIIIRYDCSLRCVYINPSYIKVNGITHLETRNEISTQWQSALEEYNYILQEVITTGEDAEFVLKFSRENNGRFSSYAINVVAERKPEGQVLGVLVIAHDITNIKDIEDRLTQSHKQLRGLAARLVTIKEEKKKNIAREMHDELGQYLTALRMGIGVLKMHFKENNPVVLNQVNDLKSLVDHIIIVVRGVVERMRPAALDMGIIAGLEWLTDDFSNRTGTVCKLRTNKKEIVLDDNHATAIFRMVQESLTNITRHAQANQVEISFIDQANHYILEVRDNGKGFDPSIIHAKSFGLAGLRERAIMLNGELNIISKLNCGTRISLKIPIENDMTKSRDD